MVFQHLDKFYPEGVNVFRQMIDRHGIELPKNICCELSTQELEEMARIALSMAPLWENALGKDWKKKIDVAQLIAIYRKI